MISKQPKVFPGHKVLHINTHVCIWIKGNCGVVILCPQCFGYCREPINLLKGYITATTRRSVWNVRKEAEFTYFCQLRVYYHRSRDPSSLQPTDKTYASDKFLPATLNLMYMKKYCTKSNTVIEQSLDDFS